MTKTLNDEADQMFGIAVDEHFQDGMESRFSRWLVAFIAEHGERAMQPIARAIRLGNVAVAGEALRWLGHIEDDTSTYESRKEILLWALFHRSHYVRDGGLLGLASIDDPQTLPTLRAAHAQETIAELKRDIAAIIKQLWEG